MGDRTWTLAYLTTETPNTDTYVGGVMLGKLLDCPVHFRAVFRADCVSLRHGMPPCHVAMISESTESSTDSVRHHCGVVRKRLPKALIIILRRGLNDRQYADLAGELTKVVQMDRRDPDGEFLSDELIRLIRTHTEAS